MTDVSTASRRGGYLERPSTTSLADTVGVILDKGLVIDAYVRISLVGIELITIDARIVVASIDTYLRFAEATNRVDLSDRPSKTLPEVIQDIQSKGAEGKVAGIIEGAKDALIGPKDHHYERARRQRAEKAPSRRPDR